MSAGAWQQIENYHFKLPETGFPEDINNIVFSPENLPKSPTIP